MAVLKQKGVCHLYPIFLLMSLLFAQESSALTEAELQSPQGLEKISSTRKLAQEGTFKSLVPDAQGNPVTISYVKFQGGKQQAVDPAVVIFPGYSEPWLKYDELISELLEFGFQVYAMDHRGMGMSTKLAPFLAHVEKVDDYVEDSRLFLEQVVFPQTFGPIYLIGHSLGGLVATLTLPKLKEPHRISSVALNAPLFELNTGFIPLSVARLVVSFQVFSGFGDRIVLGRSRYRPQEEDPKNCRTTHSVVRCQRAIDLVLKKPDLLIEAPTARWVQAVMQATTDINVLAESLKNHPVLMTQAGIDDYVGNKPQEQVCAKLSQCVLKKFSEGRHELLHETDSIRVQVVGLIKEFFAQKRP